MNSEPCIKILKALADETRWRIVGELLCAPLAMMELAGRLAISPYNISKHVRILREAGIVTARKEGKNVECGIAPELRQKLSADKAALDLGCCTFRFDKKSKCRR